MSVFEKGLIAVLGCDLLFVLLAIPLVLRRVPRNIVYGFRTRATLSNDFIWHEANAHFGRDLIISSLISTILAMVLYVTRCLSPEFFLKASIAVLVAPPLVATLATARYIRTLAPGGPSRNRPQKKNSTCPD